MKNHLLFIPKTFGGIMNSFIRSVMAALSITLVGYSVQAQLTQEYKNKLADEMKVIASIYSNEYAPKEWKEKHLGWNLQEKLNESLNKIASAESVYDYRKALADFIKSTQDYHVGIGFYSTEKSSLPFMVRTIEGKTVIVEINRKKLSEEAFPFFSGDEVVAINNKPIAEVLKELVEDGGHNVPGTDLAMADIFVTNRLARRNMKVPRGPVTITLLRAKEKTPVNHQLVWEYQKEIAPGAIGKKANFESTKNQKIELPLPKMVSESALDLENVATSWGIGQKNSFMPALGDKIWESAEDSIFDAYIYQSKTGKLVGVIRIPSYTPEDEAVATAEMAKVIEKMEKQTSALVIDQVNNPGGSVFYLYSLVSLLTKQTVTTPQHKMVLSESKSVSAFNILESLKNVKNDEEAKKAIGETVSGYPVTYQLVVNVREWANFIIEQWQAGKKISDPYYIFGVDNINPNPKVNYSKPIVILVNELDFSGGDFFPAIMQDNKRATIVGTRTAGAGGYVNSINYPNSFGFSGISFTGSIAERADRNPIENLGVTPDVELKLTLDDVRQKFKNYNSKVNEIVDSLIK